MDMLPMLGKMAVLFAAMALGYAANRLRILDESSNAALARLTIDVTLPCSILYSAVSGERVLSNAEVLKLTVLACALALSLVVLSAALSRLFRIPAGQNGVCRFMMIFSNGAFLGFPVLRAVLGPQALFYASVINMVFTVLSYTYGVAIISEGKDGRRMPGRGLLTPAVVCSLVGYLSYLVKLRAPAMAVEVLAFIDQATSPLSLISVGCALAAVPLAKLIEPWRVYLLQLLKMLGFPLLCWYVAGLLGVPDYAARVVLITMAMPPAASTTVFCAKYGSDTSVASSTVFVTTLLCMLTVPLVCAIAMN